MKKIFFIFLCLYTFISRSDVLYWLIDYPDSSDIYHIISLNDELWKNNEINDTEFLDELRFMVDIGYLQYNDALRIIEWKSIANSNTNISSEIKNSMIPRTINIVDNSEENLDSSSIICFTTMVLIILLVFRLERRR